ncbi:tetratricopeptide repeat protein [Bartonella sp. F02]|uniref:tetratricopeptide repeat protein n=1 Tax=Bartonella sp. F02 TaxID=2967262 RepID=UPI0022A8DF58|nr:tetratricopeptide repeat protein [Bartonella sp. F02]MCZ2328830.1 sel1 repeat family protein [Bartonella sp. F02]
MIKKTAKMLSLGIAWLGLAGASALGKDDSLELLSRDFNTIQDSSDLKKKKPIKILKPGQYDEAYDYYVQGYYLKAFRAALRRAENNDPFAQTLIGKMYLEGYAVPIDGARAALWFGRAAKQGDPQAQLRYGLMLLEGTFIKKNQQKAEEFIQKAVQAGVKEAYFYYGQLLLEKALPHDQVLAGVSSQSPDNTMVEQALMLFLKGAALGEPEAAFAAAQILASGTLTRPKDDDNARKLLEVAASSHHRMAQMILAQWLVQGRGGEIDVQRAFDLFFDNAFKMIIPAQIELARFYRDGIGTTSNPIMAAAWYLVAKQNNEQVLDLENMLHNMSHDQLKEAQQQAMQLFSSF